MNSTRTMTFHMPEDPEFLQAVARVSIAHSHLDYALRMCVKTLANLSIADGLDATDRESSQILRDRTRKLARMRLREGPPLLRLQAILKRCQDATQKRNSLIHNIVAVEEGGEPRMRTSDNTWAPLPTATVLNELAGTLTGLTNELNHARLHGFIAEALLNRKLPPGFSDPV